MKKKLIFLLTTVILLSAMGITAFAESAADNSFSITTAANALVNCVPALVVAIISILTIVLLCIFSKRLQTKLDGSSASAMINTFIICFSASGITCLVFALLTDGVTWTDMLVNDSLSYIDRQQFSDFFNTMRTVAVGNFDELSTEYSPFSISVYCLLSQFAPSNLVASESISTYITLLTNQPAILMYLFLVIICVVFIYRLSRSQLRQNGLKIRDEITAFLLVVSYPSMYCISLGNISAACLAGALFFILFRDSENKVYRYISLIVLILSASVSPYVLVFSLLLFTDKGKQGTKPFLIVLAGFIVLNITPCFFIGFDCALNYIRALFSISTEEFVVGNTSISNLLVFFGVDNKVILYAIFILTQLIAIVGFFLFPETWQKTSAAVYIILNMPALSNNVMYLFVFIPFVFLIGKKQHKSLDWLYLLSYSLIIIPFPEWYYFDSENFEVLLSAFGLPYISVANNLISLTAVQLLLVLMLYQIVSLLKQSNAEQKPEPAIFVDPLTNE